MEYAGKSAIITGGATGIGHSLALSLAKNGCNVAIADIDFEKARATAEHVRSTGGVASAYHCDVADCEQVGTVFADAFKEFGRIEFGFINAGVVQLAKLADLEPADLQWMFSVNVFGALYCAKSFISETRKAGSQAAHITFTGSENSLSFPSAARNDRSGGYNMTKHAIHAMADVFRFELRDEGISVSIAIPGGVNTEIVTSIEKRQQAFGGPGKLDFADLDMTSSEVARPRNLSADEVAEAILAGTASKKFYIPTHPHVLEDFLSRATEIESAFAS